MIESIDGLPDGIIGVRGIGEFTVDDFTETVEPQVEDLLAAGTEIRLLVHLGEQFEGFGEGAWGDLTSELVRIRFEKGAMVTDDGSLSAALNVLKWTLAGDVRTFRNDEFDKAVRWVAP